MISRQLRHFGTFAAFLACLALSGCRPKPKPDATAGQAAAASGANDQKIVDLMEKMRARALAAPGGAPEAADFAYNVTQLYTQGVTKRRQVSPTLVDEAVKCLDDARMAKPDDAADLLARKGEMLLAAEKTDAGVGALRGSMAERPNLRAFKPLIRHYETHQLTAEVEALCKRALPAMTSEQNRYVVLDECLKASGAPTPEAGLKWAGAKETSFYKARKKDLDARAAAASKAKAKEEAGEKK
jgi:outer membrane murein-binding lipoprotein Lpp